MENDPASVAEQRANAVAKLRRAASLPRMKDGRRPPMHIEAVSDGEKFQPEEEYQAPHPPPELPSNGETNTDSPPELKSSTPDPSTVGRKRRNRSRSRSRGSKDYKGKVQPPQSPVPVSVTPSNDSSPDDSPLSPPAAFPPPPSVVAPIPSYFNGSPASRVLMSPNVLSPATPLLYPDASPAPLMPTLYAIQKGFLRPNGIAARKQALQKLTGGYMDPQGSASPSPPTSPQPSFGKLGRNNTVSGGERSAARMKLFIALNDRIKEADEAGTSGGEERRPVIHIPARRRRRSARHSAGASTQATATDESEVLSTVTGTPIHPSIVLPYTQPAVPDPDRTTLATPIPIQQTTTPNINLNESIAGSRQATPVRAVSNQWKRRSIVVEQDDDVAVPPQSTYPGLPATRRHPSPSVTQRLPHSSDAPSNASTDSTPGIIGVPLYLSVSQETPSRQDIFPSSPFATPHKEISLSSRDEGDGIESEEPEEVVYPAEHLRRSPYHDAYNRQISWIADPVPESSIAVHNEDDEDEEQSRSVVEEEDDQIPPESPHEESSPCESLDSKELVIELETSPEPTPALTSPRPSSLVAMSNTASLMPTGDESDSSLAYPQRLSVASRIQGDRSPLAIEFDFDNSVSAPPETPLKREGSIGAWSKMIGVLTRSGSGSGRRSRTNSIATRERRQNTDSSISRESGASLASPKADKNELGSAYPQQPVMQSSSASTSMQSLALPTPPRSGVSPIPLASSLDLTKYNDAKLFPFPGIKKLEEQRINNRNRGLSISSASTPDIVLSLHGHENEIPLPSSSSSNTPSPDIKRDRVLTHQASDTHLLYKFKNPNSLPLSTAPSSSSHDYANTGLISPQSTGSILLKSLPTNREGVRKWLSSRFGSSTPTLVTTSPMSTPQTIRPHAPSKKPSLSEILRWKKENDLTDWEDIGSPEKSRNPTSSTDGNLLLGKPTNGEFSPVSPNGSTAHDDTQKTPRASKIPKPGNGIAPSPVEPFVHPALGTSTSPPTPSPPEPGPSSTPEPWSSLSDYPPPTTSESSSNTSSQYSEHLYKSVFIMERLDEMIGHGPRSSVWPSAIDDPPRKLLLAAAVLQVVNANTVKDRFLFLFNDIFIIAKPIIQDADAFLELTKPNPSDRKFVVKNVVLLRNLCYSGEREEPQSRTASCNALTESFVEQFARDPDPAIVSLFNKSGQPDDPVTLAQLLLRTPEIDRAQLSDYLCRRTSRVVLRHYLDAFGFTAVRVDKALRIFLQTVNLPARTTHGVSPIDILLDSFASRWYEANAAHVAYDKDLAHRFSRAIVQLNEVLHGGISQEPGSTGYMRRNVSSRDFLDAFRRHDPRCLLSDDLLGDVYDSIRREQLSQARCPSSKGPAEITVTFKRALPPRLTYRVQSEPVVIRIPQPDPNFTIELFGHDLTFDPPVLSFAKSSEASFRVMGVSFGHKTLLMLRSGLNALLYTGIPQTCPISVERAFMRNTFQVAFSNHTGAKRRYMFSFADPLVRHEWTTSLKRLMEALTNAPSAALSNTPYSLHEANFNKAVNDIVFRVLQETLIGPEAVSIRRSPSRLNNALKRLNPTSQFCHDSGPPDMVRSKSRSRTYHRHGPGKLEPGSNNFDPSHSRGSSEDDGNEAVPQSRPEERLWSGKDLEIFCKQNSSIAQVLELLLPVNFVHAIHPQ
ncbi:hypothetical protein PAXRUDRAFT_547649 [Paxillus rubicundulus Ve08.2h10]|uniref:Unplaced genomic scaffold scaffold_41, whole genome shotgun sequence n=1 Tax=Paxillus rubicundulus Ve08.2h10 TaxID=930991 RepID=A0A0D0E4K7_9AGAM|nr:hypothetical protein PAXRUDRAFT_547649 [Paxillus rubicundulus Ve08.2h10]